MQHGILMHLQGEKSCDLIEQLRLERVEHVLVSNTTTWELIEFNWKLQVRICELNFEAASNTFGVDLSNCQVLVEVCELNFEVAC